MTALITASPACQKRYTITEELRVPMARPAVCLVENIDVQVPPDTDDYDLPKPRDIDRFRQQLKDELARRDLCLLDGERDAVAQYEIIGQVWGFERGSGLLRVLTKDNYGHAHAAVSLAVVDLVSGETIFAGEFRGSVTTWLEGGEEALHTIAKDFAKALDEQLKHLKK